jgi:hypothetical protein
LLPRQEYIRVSIEINLFFQRIIKEHLFFIETNLPPVETAFIGEANVLKQSFEQLLADTVTSANGIISENAIKSNEIVTPYTLSAEEITSKLTGANLNTNITKVELRLTANSNSNYSERLENIVCDINDRSINMLKEVIALKKRLLDLVLKCKIFTTLYPEMLEHITREAEYYLKILESLQERKFPMQALCEELNFWNHIMGEHAEFIDGMLDPTEKNLKETAEIIAEKFEKLVEECTKASDKQIIKKSSEATEEIRNFKRASTEGLLKCQIKSIIPPLLADHVLREANHYLRLLKMMNISKQSDKC